MVTTHLVLFSFFDGASIGAAPPPTPEVGGGGPGGRRRRIVARAPDISREQRRQEDSALRARAREIVEPSAMREAFARAGVRELDDIELRVPSNDEQQILMILLLEAMK